MSQEQNAESNDLILTSENKPFKTEHSAVLTIQNKKLNPETHKVVPHEDGWAIKITEAATPIETKETPKSENKPASVPFQQPKEKYYKIKFHAKRSKEDEDDVILAVNCEELHFQREKIVTVPERFVVCARNAQYPQFTHKPGEGRKIVGHINVFPFDLLGEGTEQEYRSQRAAGTKAQSDEVKRLANAI